MNNLIDRITIDSQICNGKPTMLRSQLTVINPFSKYLLESKISN